MVVISFDYGKQNSSQPLVFYVPCINDPTLRIRFATDAKKRETFSALQICFNRMPLTFQSSSYMCGLDALGITT